MEGWSEKAGENLVWASLVENLKGLAREKAGKKMSIRDLV